MVIEDYSTSRTQSHVLVKISISHNIEGVLVDSPPPCSNIPRGAMLVHLSHVQDVVAKNCPRAVIRLDGRTAVTVSRIAAGRIGERIILHEQHVCATRGDII